jgi:predicted O-methyltransferase YrrM
VEPGWVTAETGLGVSTVAFALLKARHICITPNQEEVARLREYCTAPAIALDRVRFVVAPSQDVVPTLPETELDFVLVDGGHGFPVPFLDWFYLSRRLKVGGLVMIDDTQLWTGKVLADFLDREPGWTRERSYPRTVVFRMTAPFRAEDWPDQPFVAGRSRWSIKWANLALGARLLAKGDIGGLWAGMTKRLPEA